MIAASLLLFRFCLFVCFNGTMSPLKICAEGAPSVIVFSASSCQAPSHFQSEVSDISNHSQDLEHEFPHVLKILCIT